MTVMHYSYLRLHISPLDIHGAEGGALLTLLVTEPSHGALLKYQYSKLKSESMIAPQQDLSQGRDLFPLRTSTFTSHKPTFELRVHGMTAVPWPVLPSPTSRCFWFINLYLVSKVWCLVISADDTSTVIT